MPFILRSFSVVFVLSLPSFVFAQDELGPFNQKIADKWTLSLESLPKHLESRQRGEEVLYIGDLTSEAMAEKILAADSIPPARPISQLVNRSLFSGLQRQIKSKFLIDIIKTGRLEPRTYQVGSNEEETSLIGVYLELHRTDNPKPFEWGDVELDFDLSVLDRTDYLINPYWDFGHYGPLTASAELNPARVAFYVSSYLAEGTQNEVVFLNAVPFSSIRKIFILGEKKRQEILQQIRASGLKCPQRGGCEALIESR